MKQQKREIHNHTIERRAAIVFAALGAAYLQTACLDRPVAIVGTPIAVEPTDLPDKSLIISGTGGTREISVLNLPLPLAQIQSATNTLISSNHTVTTDNMELLPQTGPEHYNMISNGNLSPINMTATFTYNAITGQATVGVTSGDTNRIDYFNDVPSIFADMGILNNMVSFTISGYATGSRVTIIAVPVDIYDRQTEQADQGQLVFGITLNLSTGGIGSSWFGLALNPGVSDPAGTISQ